MFKFLFLILLSLPAYAQSPWYFGSGEAVNLTNGTAYKNGVKTIAGSLDPSTVAVSAPSGSMYYSTSGTIYVKQDAGLSTNWLPLGIATTGTLSTINGQSGPGVNIATGSTGTDFNIAAAANTITLNLPTASATVRGLLSLTDWSTFNSKQDAITGAASTITSSNLTTNRAVISNASGKVAVSAVTDTELGYLSGVTSSVQSQLDGKEPPIAAGTTSQYWRGDKSWQTLDKTAVGLGNIDNTSDAAKPISTATQVALDEKISGMASSVDGEIVLFNGTTGKVSKRSSGSGIAKLSSGVLSTTATIDASTELTGVAPLANGGTNKNITAANGGVVYTDTDSQEVTAAGTTGQFLKSNGAAAPAWADIPASTIAANQEAGDLAAMTKLIAPSNQFTQRAAGEYLFETGNNNLLSNPGYEHSTFDTGWTCTGVTPVVETTIVAPGSKKSMKLILSSATGECYQDATNGAAYASNVQFLAMLRAKASISAGTVKVCARQAGVTSTTLCNSNTEDTFNYKEIPVSGSTTSNGISFVFTSATGTIYLDDAFVGPTQLRQSADASRIAGESYFAANAGCIYTRTSTTVGPFTADTDCVGPTITDQSMGEWQTTDSDLPRQTINKLPAGKYVPIFDATTFAGTASATLALAITDGTTTCTPQAAGEDSSFSTGNTVSCVFNYANAGNRSFELVGAASAGTVNINASVVTPPRNVKFKLMYYGSGSTYSTANADTNWAACNFSSLGWQGLGTSTLVTNTSLRCKRQGSDLLMRGRFTTGTVNGSIAQMPLPLWNGTQLTSSAAIGTNETSNAFFRSVANQSTLGAIILQPSVAYVNFSAALVAVANNPTTPLAGSALFGSSEAVEVTNLRIPINGWDNSNVIIGQFNEVMTTPGITKPKTCYYGFGGPSATLAAPTECTTGTCVEVIDTCGTISPPARSSAGLFTDLTIASGTFAASTFIKCECKAFSTTTATYRECNQHFVTSDNTWSTNVSGGFTGNFALWNATGTMADGYVSIECEGVAP